MVGSIHILGVSSIHLRNDPERVSAILVQLSSGILKAVRYREWAELAKQGISPRLEECKKWRNRWPWKDSDGRLGNLVCSKSNRWL